jgi:hypothetical protein
MNPDECFSKAGFRDFGDGDDRYEKEFEILLDVLIEELLIFGVAEVESSPLKQKQTLWDKF